MRASLVMALKSIEPWISNSERKQSATCCCNSTVCSTKLVMIEFTSFIKISKLSSSRFVELLPIILISLIQSEKYRVSSMPRVKTTPNRKSSNDLETSQNIGNESVLDDEEIERLEQELESLRREKAKQIRKMRIKREENRHLCYGSTESSSEGAEEEYSEQYEDEDQTIEPAVKARQTTRDLADGFEKAHKRFMFNVQNLERKYAEREQRGLPESHIEIDRYGNFYFPENMVPSRQQTFVNRMFQYHSLFGKGSVSAPRNSIQSFDGDHQALKRSLQLDEKFGKKERETEQYGNRCQRKKCRIISSSYVSGIPKVEFYSTSSCSSRYNSRYPE
ncbi:hypothetical protein GCK72_002115 [Caenorhabditis remanei]|uniref:Uncharacterized protein n=1 Tax=Caenorhabditis remanei TaxID=31234 RepID=A0A6A5HVK4_CAERE|nr:hypothetical protein GCK72_002115 [Caenorhabditis remanei]KAF1770297.1 hypothetical protein GCK72_002115 [Caenorhabditis remanei]